MKILLAHFRSNFKKILLISSLAFVNIFQTYIVISNYGKLWVSRTVRTFSLPAMERNALFVFGGNGLEFLDFLSTTIPPNAAIVIPPNKVQFSRQNLLQFFLYPRKVLTCYCDEKSTDYSAECIECLRMNNYFVPAIGEFPSGDVMQGSKTFISFDKDTGWYHGVYAPLDFTPSESISTQYQNHQLIPTIISDFLICFLILLLGYHLSSIVLNSRESEIALAAAFPVGIGVMTWLVFIIAWIGFPLSLATFISVYIAISITIAVIKRSVRKERFILHPTSIGKSILQDLSGIKPAFLVVLLIVIFMFAVSTIISVGRGYSVYDGIANWALKGYAISNEGSIYTGEDWGGHGLSYPMNIHLMIALYNFADGDILPGSKIAYSIFAASLLYGCYKALRRMKIDNTISLLGTLGFFTIPIIFMHSTYGMGNFIFTTYIVLGTLNLIEGALNQRTDILILGGLLLSFGTWTRPEGIAFATLLALAVFLTLKFMQNQITWSKKLMLLAIIPISYFAFSLASIRKDEIGNVLQTFLSGDSPQNPIRDQISMLVKYALDRFFVFKIWGFVPILILLLFCIAVVRKKDLQDKAMTLALSVSTVIAFSFPMVMFAFASFSKSDLISFLAVSFDRAMMPAMILSILTSISIAAHLVYTIQTKS